MSIKFKSLEKIILSLGRALEQVLALVHVPLFVFLVVLVVAVLISIFLLGDRLDGFSTYVLFCVIVLVFGLMGGFIWYLEIKLDKTKRMEVRLMRSIREAFHKPLLSDRSHDEVSHGERNTFDKDESGPEN